MQECESGLLRVLVQAVTVSVFGLVACTRTPTILSGYGSDYAVTANADGSQRLRDRPHDGVDIEGDVGDPVLAAGPGRVAGVQYDLQSGFEIVIAHEGIPPDKQSRGAVYLTSYIHLRKPIVMAGEMVQRGQKIGEIGLFWASGGVAHVHWRVCRGICRDDSTLDPLSRQVRCFSSSQHYPLDRLLLTYPVRC